MANQRILVGAGVDVYINGKNWGTVNSFIWESSTPHEEQRGIDTTSPFEYAIGQTSVSGQVSLFKVQNNGGLEGLGVTGGYKDYLRERYFTLLLIEQKTQTILFKADRCCVQSQTWKVEAKAQVQGAFNFSGIEWVNEFSKTPHV